MSASEEQDEILKAYSVGLMSKEDRDRLLNDITPALWEELRPTFDVYQRGCCGGS